MQGFFSTSFWNSGVSVIGGCERDLAALFCLALMKIAALFDNIGDFSFYILITLKEV